MVPTPLDCCDGQAKGCVSGPRRSTQAECSRNAGSSAKSAKGRAEKQEGHLRSARCELARARPVTAMGEEVMSNRKNLKFKVLINQVVHRPR